MDIVFAPEQQKAIDVIWHWWKHTNDKVFVLAGYAGTGKTTLAKQVAKMIDEDRAPFLDRSKPIDFQLTRFCAYTGKAANVLREKGCKETSTIHGVLYSASGPAKRAIQELEVQIATTREPELKKKLKKELAALRKSSKKPKFFLNEEKPLRDSPLVIVDEYSMLNTKIIKDLETVAQRVLYLGDPFQLPPVGGECTIEPTLFLEEIHRQALDSPILRYATAVRNGDNLDYCNEGDFIYDEQSKFDFKESKWPMAGEKLICLRNNHEMGLFNGLIVNTLSNSELVDHDHFIIDVDGFTGLPIWTGDIQGRGFDYDPFDKKLQGANPRVLSSTML